MRVLLLSLALALNALGQDADTLARQADEQGRLIATVRDTATKRSYGEKALDLAKQAVAADPTSSKAQVILAISYGRLAELLDNKTKISYAKLIKDHAEKALALDPNNDLACHVLGSWNYEMANLNPILRAIARTLYGDLPPGSNEEAIRYLTRAVKLKPDRLSARVDLGRAYLAADEPQKAREQFEAALKLPSRDSDDAATREKARQALR